MGDVKRGPVLEFHDFVQVRGDLVSRVQSHHGLGHMSAVEVKKRTNISIILTSELRQLRVNPFKKEKIIF